MEAPEPRHGVPFVAILVVASVIAATTPAHANPLAPNPVQDLAPAHPVYGVWTEDTVHQSDDSITIYPSLVVDADNRVQLSFLDSCGRLLYATETPLGWTTETIVDRSTPGFESVQVCMNMDDRNLALVDGVPYVAVNEWSGDTTGRILVFHKTGSSWVYDVVATYPLESDGATKPSLAVGPDGVLHMAYWLKQPSKTVYHAWLDQDGWHTEVAATPTSLFAWPAVAVGPDNDVHIIYTRTKHVVAHAQKTPGGWTTEDVFENALSVGHMAAAVAPNGTVMTVIGTELPGIVGVSFAWKHAGAWSTTLLTSNGREPSIAVDAAGTPHVAYVPNPTWIPPGLVYNYESGRTVYATHLPGVSFHEAWIKETLPRQTEVHKSWGTSIGIDHNQRPAVAYGIVTAGVPRPDLPTVRLSGDTLVVARPVT